MQIIIETTRRQLLQLFAGIFILFFLTVICSFWAGGDVVRGEMVRKCKAPGAFVINGFEGVFVCIQAR